MNLSHIKLATLGAVILTSVASVAEAQTNSRIASGQRVLRGTVQRVWDDGFRLQTGSQRGFRVDSYDICGDNTRRSLSSGERVTVTGEFEDGEFDAFSIVKADGTQVCRTWPRSRR